MIQAKYLQQIKAIILQKMPQAKLFVFGSAIISEKFADVDIGIIDTEIKETELNLIKENLENSNLPYKIDVVDFMKVEKKFKDKVFNSKITWLT